MKNFLFLCSLALFVGCGPRNVEDKPAEAPVVASDTDQNEARQLPSFSMMGADGNIVDLNSFNGKKVFVNLWATWCPPCRREMPSIQKLYKSIDKSKTVFVMLALDDNFDKAKKYIAANKLDLPLYYPAGNLPQLFQVPGIPTTFIFNETGQLIHKTEGSDDYDRKEYRQMLK